MRPKRKETTWEKHDRLTRQWRRAFARRVRVVERAVEKLAADYLQERERKNSRIPKLGVAPKRFEDAIQRARNNMYEARSWMSGR